MLVRTTFLSETVWHENVRLYAFIETEQSMSVVGESRFSLFYFSLGQTKLNTRNIGRFQLVSHWH